MQFEAFDRHLGMVLGGLEGALLGLVATMFTVSLAPQTRDPIFRSPSGQVVGQIMDALGPILPGEIRSALASSWGPPSMMAGPEEVVSERRRPRVPLPAGDDPLTGLKDVIEKGEASVGKAIADAARTEFQGIGGADARSIERR